MDFDASKENIQPLAAGRNASILQASLHIDSQRELRAQRQELENAINTYQGDDPLEVWYDYITWIEQSFPSGGKESGLEEVLTKCLICFEGDECYFQDRRLIKIFIKYIEMHKNQGATEFYQQLFDAGIGTMVADFYICWAYCYDLNGNYRKADEIFQRGIDCRAEPLDELQEAHQHFGFTVSRRMLYQDDKNETESANKQLQERRLALSNLRSHQRRVGSMRTGKAVKSFKPGNLEGISGSSSNRSSNIRVQILADENANSGKLFATNFLPVMTKDKEARSRSVVSSIIQTVRDQENKKEPGPWNKQVIKKKGKIFNKACGSSELGFEILEDGHSITAGESAKQDTIRTSPIIIEKALKPFPNFKSRNRPLPEWITPVTIENTSQPLTFPQYNKNKLYPRPNLEYQLEELLAYNWFRKRGITNKFTDERAKVWKSYEIGPVRNYPNFARKSRQQQIGQYYEFNIPEKISNLMVPFDQLYDRNEKIEMQNEELLAKCWKAGHRKLKYNPNDTIMIATDMEETVCESYAGNPINRRKSFFPSSKSVASSHRTNSRFSSISKANMQSTHTLEEGTMVSSTVQDPNHEIHSVEQFVTHEQMTACESIQNCNDDVQRMLQKSFEAFKIFKSTAPIPDSDSKPLESMNCRAIGYGLSEGNTENLQKSEAAHCDKFDFKTPSGNSASIQLGKIPFEIYEEDVSRDKAESINTQRQEPFPVFEADETCSTQAFNFFIKSQSVSTPNAPQKTTSRIFGTVLKERIEPDYLMREHLALPSSIAEYSEVQLKSGETTVNYSPPVAPQKQLSTILEISEQGTTNTNTKLSDDSPKSQEPLEIKEGTAFFQTQFKTNNEEAAGALNTYKRNVTEVVIKNKLHDSLLPQKDQQQTDIPTPVAARLQKSCTMGTREQIGNFSRLEEREETREICSFIPVAVEFEEERTETTRTIFTSMQNNKFPDSESLPGIMKSIIPSSSQNVEEKPRFGPLLRATKESTGPAEELFDFFTKTPPISEKYDKISNNSYRSMANTADFLNFDNRDSLPKLLKAPSLGNQTPEACRQKQYRENNLTSFGSSDNFFLKSPDNFLKKTECKNSFMSEISPVEEYNKSVRRTPTQGIQNAPPQKENMQIIEDSQAYFESSFKLLKNSKSSSHLPRITSKRPRNSFDFSKTKPSKNSFTINISGSIRDSQPLCNERLLKSPKYVDKIGPEYHDSTNISNLSVIANSQPWETQKNVKYDIPINVETGEHMLTDSFMKDFSSIERPSSPPNADIDKNQRNLIKPSKESLHKSAMFENINVGSYREILQQNSKNGLFSYLPNKKDLENGNGSFELNADTAQFVPNQRNIRNSTLLADDSKNPQIITLEENLSNQKQAFSKTIEEYEDIHRASDDLVQSLRSYEAIYADNSTNNNQQTSNENNLQMKTLTKKSLSMKKTLVSNPNNFSTSLNSSDSDTNADANSDNDNDGVMSIYFKHTPKTPKIERHIWNDSHEEEGEHLDKDNTFVHVEINPNETQNNIEKICLDENVNPFDINLNNLFLDQISFTNYIDELSSCELVGKVGRLHKDSVIKVNNVQFKVQKLVGEGAYGAVYCATETKTGKKYALKQERPPNFWEYYICLEVHDRLTVDELRPAFMSIDYALIGRNSSILIAPFSSYGTLITVCNKIKKVTTKNPDEYVVMHISCLLLEVIDHLHALEIIHGDIKPDNFLLMDKLSSVKNIPSIQLIDFGVSIDMRRFKKDQTFQYTGKDKSRNCVEMRESRPWTYQLDLYGLAETIHVMLFGTYMDVHKVPATGFWMHKTRVPRYLNKVIWETIFTTLLNVHDCSSMPNLQRLRVLLKEGIAEKENYCTQRICEFNRALDC